MLEKAKLILGIRQIAMFYIIDLRNLHVIMLSWATKLESVLQSTPFLNNLNDLTDTL